MKIQTEKIKAHEADRLARSLLEAASKAFENPKMLAEYEAWQAKRAKEAATYGTH